MKLPFIQPLLVFCLSFASTHMYAQPANDDCINAINITPQSWNTTCNFGIDVSTQNATPSANAPSCAGSAANDDIWYSFTATATNIVVRFSGASLLPSGATGLALALYNANCPADNSAFFCNGGFGFNSGHVIINGLTIGEKVYLRCWSPGNSNAMQFKLCVQNLPLAPVNDNCEGATALTVQPFGQACTNSVSVNTLGATPSATPATSCGGTDNNDDVWLKFTATSAQHILRYSNLAQLLGNPNNLGLTIYDGGPSGSASCPGNSTNILCNAGFGFFGGYHLQDGFIQGNTYFIRIWAGGQQNFSSFDLCVQEVPPPPANDDCANATALTVQPFGQTCTNSITVNTAGATASAVPPTTCGNDSNNDDVWLKFTATSAQHIFRYSNQAQLLGTPNNLGMTIYNGGPSGSANCPATSTNIFCSGGFGFFGGYELIGGFTPGNTYFIRIWAGGQQNFTSFDFCVQEVPPPTPNDDCAGAIALTVQPFGQTCTAAITVNTAGATASAVPPTTCGNDGNNDDMWMKFTATSAQHIFRYTNLTQLLGTPNNLGITIYEGSPSGSAACPASNENILCIGAFGFFNGYYLSGGFTPGNTYFIRIWAGGQQNFASFEFCVQEVPPPPANDDCAGAIALTVQPFGQSCTNAIAVNTAGATASAVPPTTCGNDSNNDDVWMKFTATSAQHIIRYSNLIQLLGPPNNIGMTIYNVGPSDAAVCPVSQANIFCTAAFGFFNGYHLLGGFIIGNTYYVRIWAGGAQNFASVDFCVQEVPPPPANDECINATEISLESSALACSNPIMVNTAGATQSTNQPSCQSGNFSEEDVWYRFTATSAKIRLIYSDLQQLLGTPNSIGFAFYKSGCPISGSSFICQINFGFFSAKTILEGFEPGETYYFRTWASGNENFASFSLCLQAVIPPPNDECNTAIDLAVGAGFCTQPAIINMFDATTSSGFNNSPSCRGGSRTEDVWYTAIIPPTGNLVVQTSPANTSVNDLVMVAYTGSCNALAQIDCNDNGNPDPAPAANHPKFAFSGRTPGEKITFRVVSVTEQGMGRFATCAIDTTYSVLPAIAPEGNCQQDTILISDSLANGYRWIPVLDHQGRIIAEYFPNSSAADTLFTSLFVNSTGTIRQKDNKLYLDRNLHLSTRNLPLNGRIRIYIKSAEIAVLTGSDSTIAGTSNLVLLSDTSLCRAAIITHIHSYTSFWASYSTDYYVQTNGQEAGNFFLEGACGNDITWTGAQNNNWHNPSNWSCGGVPWVQSNVTIPAGTPHSPVISQRVEIRSLKLNSNANVNIQPGVPVILNSMAQ